jgi:hypothetical protein
MTSNPVTFRMSLEGPELLEADRWSDFRRRHQARSRWFHQRARLAKDTEFAQVN